MARKEGSEKRRDFESADHDVRQSIYIIYQENILTFLLVTWKSKDG